MFPAFSTSDVNSPVITSVTTEFTFCQQLISDIFFLVFASNDMFTSHHWHGSLVFLHWYILTAFWRFLLCFSLVTPCVPAFATPLWLVFPRFLPACSIAILDHTSLCFLPLDSWFNRPRYLFGLYLVAMDKVQCSFLTQTFSRTLQNVVSSWMGNKIALDFSVSRSF